uniref:RNase H type-1 domain-containing protein n=1 Tax=Panagrolaimus sp. JU765 TaxID=591449 RepID=A0AC34PXQ3_9BILA
MFRRSLVLSATRISRICAQLSSESLLNSNGLGNLRTSTSLSNFSTTSYLKVAQKSNVAEAADWHDVPIVSTSFASNGRDAFMAIYWGQNDVMNVYKPSTIPGATIFHAALEAIMVALRQAIFERKLNRVIVQTDSKYLVDCANRYLKTWRNNGYKKKDGNDVKHAALLEDFAQLLDMIDAKIRLAPSSKESNIIELLKSDPKFAIEIQETQAGVDVFDPKKSSAGETQIYVSGKHLAKKPGGFSVASYGFHIPNKPTLDSCGRFNKFPITLTRAQMFGIIQALKIAKQEGMKNINIICDCPQFVKYYKRNWLKSDGTPCANRYLYQEIKE